MEIPLIWADNVSTTQSCSQGSSLPCSPKYFARSYVADPMFKKIGRIGSLSTVSFFDILCTLVNP